MSNQPAVWPFPDNSEVVPTNTQPITETIKAVVIKTPTTTHGNFKIEIGGRGTETAIGTITQAQYDFWSHPDHCDYLGEGMNDPDATEFENSDGDTVTIPDECRFEEYYNEYSDVSYISGPDLDSSYITIYGPDNDELYSGDFSEFVSDLGSDGIDRYETGEEVYIDDLEPGTYVNWAQGGKGLYFEGEIEIPEGEIFDPKKLRFTIDELESNQVIGTVYYGEEIVENYGGSWSGKWADYQVYEIT